MISPEGSDGRTEAQSADVLPSLPEGLITHTKGKDYSWENKQIKAELYTHIAYPLISEL